MEHYAWACGCQTSIDDAGHVTATHCKDHTDKYRPWLPENKEH